MTAQIITIELDAADAHRLLWLAQKEASVGKIFNDYWAKLADRILLNIMDDEEANNVNRNPGNQFG